MLTCARCGIQLPSKWFYQHLVRAHGVKLTGTAWRSWGFANKILKNYDLWNPHTINGIEVWRAWG
jgi:hypothetical protein